MAAVRLAATGLRAGVAERSLWLLPEPKEPRTILVQTRSARTFGHPSRISTQTTTGLYPNRNIKEVCPMHTAANVMLIVAGGLMIAEGILKLAKPDAKIMRMGLPCGGGLAILGIALVLKGAAG